jgi:hypothetical protein
LCLAACSFLCSGCIGTGATLGYWIHGVKAKAEFNGLKDQRVAIVCISDSSLYGLDTASETLARYLQATLSKEVKGIDIIRQEEVLDWIDNNDWNQIDFTEIGRGVNAQKVLAVELSSYRLNNGRTLYQGHADVTVSIYDMTDSGEVVFRRTIPSFEFPQHGGAPVTDTTRARFEQHFIYMLSQKIANFFYDYELPNDFAQDAALIGP